MKDEKKKKGGTRIGAGRKPSGRQKVAVTVYTDVSRFGGRDGTKVAIYAFLDGNFELLNQNGFWPSTQFFITPEDARKGVNPKFPPPKAKKAPKSQPEEKVIVSPEPLKKVKDKAYDAPPLPEPAGDDPVRKMEIQKQIEAVRAEKRPEYRSKASWEFDQNKRIKELESKLNGG